MSSPMHSTETGDGFDQPLAENDHATTPEAELGWLNSRCRVKADRAIDVDNLLTALVGRLGSRFEPPHRETAQLKIVGFAEGRIAAANLSGRSPVEHSQRAGIAATDIELIVNARVAMTPQRLEEEIRTAVGAVAQEFGGQAAFGETSSFRPDGAHRLVEAG